MEDRITSLRLLIARCWSSAIIEQARQELSELEEEYAGEWMMWLDLGECGA